MSDDKYLVDIDSELSAQEQLVLDWLRDNAALTELEAELNLGVKPLAPVISSLRGKGHNIYPEIHNRPPGINSPSTTVYWMCSCEDTLEKVLNHRRLHGDWTPDIRG